MALFLSDHLLKFMLTSLYLEFSLGTDIYLVILFNSYSIVYIFIPSIIFGSCIFLSKFFLKFVHVNCKLISFTLFVIIMTMQFIILLDSHS